MFPILYKSNETDFIHNGLGLLSGAIKAVATEELNGMFELQIEYDSEGFLVDEIKEEMIIKAKANDKQYEQLFRIYSITKNHENDNLIIDAQHITYDLANDFVEEMVANNITKRQVMEKILAESVGTSKQRFTMTSPNTTTRSSTSLYRTNPLQMVAGTQGSILQIWGGQIERDNFRLVLHDRRGSDDGVLVTYKKNLTGLEAKFDIQQLVTRIYPFVFDEENNQLITVPGKYIDSPFISNYEQVCILPVDFADKFENAEDVTPQQLYSVAQNWFVETGRDKPKTEMEVKFEHLWETEEYKDLAVLELVGMGDTVTIEHSKLNIFAKAIVNRIEYDCIARKNLAVDVGNIKARLTDNVNRVVDVAEKVEQAEQIANQAIGLANEKNTIYYQPDEPTDGQKDDLWFKVVDGEYTRTYRHDGIQWQLIVDMDTTEAKRQSQQAINDANQAVANANLATENATEAITQAQSAFDEAQTALTAAEGLTSRMTDAEGNISAINQTAESYGRRITDAEGNISTLSNTAKGLQNRVADAEGNISTVTQLANTLQRDLRDAEGNINTLTETSSSMQRTISSVRTDLDGLEIGGSNLLLNSGNINKWNTYSGSTAQRQEIDMTEEWGISKAFKVKTIGGSASIKLLYSTSSNVSEPLVIGQNYVYSLYFKNVGTKTIRFQINGLSPTGGSQSQFIEPGESRKLIFKGIRREAYNWFQPRVETYGNTDDSLEFIIAHEQLEKGNKTTDWSHAPEDTQSQITQLSNNINARVKKGDVINQLNISTEGILIDGKKVHITGQTKIDNAAIKSAAIQSLDAGKITAGTLDAGKVNVINLNASNIDSGKLTAIDIEGVNISGSRIISQYGTETASLDKGRMIYTIDHGTGQKEIVNVRGDAIIVSTTVPTSSDDNIKETFYAKDGIIINKFSGGNDIKFKIAGEVKSPAVNNPFILSIMDKGSYIHDLNPNGVYEGGAIRLFGMNQANRGGALTGVTSGSEGIRVVSRSNFDTFANLEARAYTANAGGTSGGITLNNSSGAGDHVISVDDSSGHLLIYGNRAYDQIPFRVRSHVNKSDYRNDFWIGSNGSVYSPHTYDTTSSSSANVRIGSSSSGANRFLRSTSAKRYKVYIEEANVDPYKLLKLKPKSWIDKNEYVKNNNSIESLQRYYGIIADEMEEIGLPEYVEYNEFDEVENIVERAWTLLIPIVNDLNSQVDFITTQYETLTMQYEQAILKIAHLEERLNKLEVAA